MPVKTFIVTGASSGIGRAIADLFHAHGHKVIGVSRRKPQDDIAWLHKACDISKPSEVKLLIAHLPSVIDGVVHAAGIGVGGAVERIEDKALEKLINVNLYGVNRINKAMIPLLSRGDQPTIIHIGSLAGIFPIPFQAHYAMSKAALMHYSDALRLELAPTPIRVTTVLLGDVKTAFTTSREHYFLKQDDRYGERPKRSIDKMARDEAKGMSANYVAKHVVRLIEKKRVPSCKTVGLMYKSMVFAAKILPRRFMLFIVYRLYGR